MIRIFKPGDLVSAPADASPLDTGNVKTAIKRLWVEIANMSPYVFEVQDEGGMVRAIAGAFQYTAFAFNPITSKYTFHVIATESASPIPSTSWAVYAGLTDNIPVPSAVVA